MNTILQKGLLQGMEGGGILREKLSFGLVELKEVLKGAMGNFYRVKGCLRVVNEVLKEINVRAYFVKLIGLFQVLFNLTDFSKECLKQNLFRLPYRPLFSDRR